jgi:PAS domain S-box-containing protein
MKLSEHDEFRKHVFDSSPMPIVVMDAETNRYLDCNVAAVKIYGYHSLEEVVGKTPLDFSAPSQYDGASSSEKTAFFIEKAQKEGTVVFEWKHQRPDGEIWDAEVHLLSFKIDGKQFLQFSLVEITERKFAEKMQKMLHDLMLDLNSCSDLHEGFNKVLMSVLTLECLDCGGIYIADPVDNSLSIAAHSGLSNEFVSLVSHFQADSPNVRMALTGEVRYGAYSEIRKGNDPIREKEGLRAFALIPIIAQGKLIALLNLSSHKYDSVPLASRSILETIAFQAGGSLLRLRTANALRESRELFELFMFHSPIYTFIKEVTATQSRVLQASDSFKTLIGVSGRDIRGKTMEEIFPADFAAKITLDDITVVANQKVIKLDEEYDNRHFTTIKFPIVQNNKTLLAGYTIDITDRKRAEEDLQNSEKRYRQLFDASPDGIVLIGSDGCIASANTTQARMYHCDSPDQLLGMHATLLVAPSFRNYSAQIMVRRLNGEAIPPVYYELIRKDGTTFFGETSASILQNTDGKITGYICITREITERKQMEEELQKVQKLDALGLLAGGIAHDFNNLMGGIFGYIDMANVESKDKKVTHYLTKALNTIDRARGLTLQLLTFAKGGAPIKKIDTLFPFIRETAQFALSGSNVSSSFDVPENLWPCDFDKNQIGQVIDNIIINAKQAMSDGGSIELSAKNITLSEKDHSPLPNGDYVKIAIKDYGIGIPKEILPRIFDPFYTTKATGHGLGLATCYSIIKRHNGCIEVESEPGKGSTFHIFLPAAKDSASSSQEIPAATHKGSGAFLIMDDEEVMRETIGSMLESLGYNVVYKENGSAAIDFVVEEIKAKRKIAGMIFDLTIPGGIGGKESIAEIRKIGLEAPAFVTSGYAKDPVMANPAEHGFVASICKPFRKSELAEMLNKYMQPKK